MSWPFQSDGTRFREGYSMEQKKDTNKRALNGMRGVHLVAAELAKHGFAPVVTMRNTPFADVLAQPLTFDGAPLAISVKYNAGGTFFLLGKNLPTNEKAFYALVMERAGKPLRIWIVPSRVLKDSPTTKFGAGQRRLDSVPPGYLGLHEGRWGLEVYVDQLAQFENAWPLLEQASRD
jgi:hypothetical protein